MSKKEKRYQRIWGVVLTIAALSAWIAGEMLNDGEMHFAALIFAAFAVPCLMGKKVMEYWGD